MLISIWASFVESIVLSKRLSVIFSGLTIIILGGVSTEVGVSGVGVSGVGISGVRISCVGMLEVGDCDDDSVGDSVGDYDGVCVAGLDSMSLIDRITTYCWLLPQKLSHSLELINSSLIFNNK